MSAPAFTIYCVDSFNTTSYGRSVLFSVSSPSICLSRFLQALAPSSFESNESDVMDGTLFPALSCCKMKPPSPVAAPLYAFRGAVSWPAHRLHHPYTADSRSLCQLHHLQPFRHMLSLQGLKYKIVIYFLSKLLMGIHYACVSGLIYNNILASTEKCHVFMPRMSIIDVSSLQALLWSWSICFTSLYLHEPAVTNGILRSCKNVTCGSSTIVRSSTTPSTL